VIDYQETMNALLQKSNGRSESKKFHVPSHGKGEVIGKVRLMIDFESPEEMLDWMKSNFHGKEVSAYAPDSLDHIDFTGNGRTINTFILKRKGDRSEEHSLQVETTFNEVV